MVHPDPGFMTEKEMEEIFEDKLGKGPEVETKIKGIIDSKEKPPINFLHWCVENEQLDEKYGIPEISVPSS